MLGKAETLSMMLMELADVTLNIIEPHHRAVVAAAVLVFLVRAATQLVFGNLEGRKHDGEKNYAPRMSGAVYIPHKRSILGF